MRGKVMLLLSYIWIIYVIFLIMIIRYVMNVGGYEGLGVQLIFLFASYAVLLERPSDVEYFTHIELKTYIKPFFSGFHWSNKITLFSFIMQIIVNLMILILLIEIYLYKTMSSLSYFRSEYFNIVSKVYIMSSMVLIVITAIVRIIGDRKTRA